MVADGVAASVVFAAIAVPTLTATATTAASATPYFIEIIFDIATPFPKH